MTLLAILSPFVGCLVAFLPGRAMGQRGAAVYSICCSALAFFSSAVLWFEVVVMGCPVSLLWGSWFSVGGFHASFSAFFDLTTAHMLLTVTGVSLAVHLYALSYMRSDPHQNLFMGYLSLFTGFMLLLVAADNLVLMLVGWEGIGVCSFLLIGYWSHRLSAIKSAQKAIMVNRISDGMLLWGVLWIWYYTGSVEYDLLSSGAGLGYGGVSAFLAVTTLVGAMGKSAQILFHVWLADAMEGPTPVSALIHAATLVTAGVYLLVRLRVHDEAFLLPVGSLTALMAGVFGAAQADMKRVIAYSTCSQLGYMICSLGLGEYGPAASMGHLVTHASFKAALFLAAGMVISGLGDQHSARLGGSSHSSLFCTFALLVGSLSLVGWPELSGFYTKEAILNLAFTCAAAETAHTLLLLAAFLTSAYSTKLLVQGFAADFSGVRRPRALLYCAVPLVILCADIAMKVWVGFGPLAAVFAPWGVKTLPFGLMLAGVLTATAANQTQSFALLRFCGSRWGFDQLFARSPVLPILDWGRLSVILSC